MKKTWSKPLPTFRKHKKKVFSEVVLTGQYIHQLGDTPKLRQSSDPVEENEFGSNIFINQIAYLKSCLKKYRQQTGVGRGITAIQVGIQKRFSVIYMPELKEQMLIIINPKITKKSSTLLRYPEVCMSASPLITPVVRPSWIEFEYFNESGEKQVWNRKDTDKMGKMYNRVFQHEIDHMNGIINIDLVPGKELIYALDLKYYDTATFEEVSSKRK